MPITFKNVRNEQPPYEVLVLLKTSDGDYFTGHRVSTNKHGEHYQAHPKLEFDSKIDVVAFAYIE